MLKIDWKKHKKYKIWNAEIGIVALRIMIISYPNSFRYLPSVRIGTEGNNMRYGTERKSFLAAAQEAEQLALGIVEDYKLAIESIEESMETYNG